RDLLAALAGGDGEIELVEDRLAANDGTARQTAGEDLGKRGQIWRHAVMTLRAAFRHAEPGDDLVEDEEYAALRRRLAQGGEEFRRQRHHAEARPRRLHDDCGDVVVAGESRTHRRGIAGRQQDRVRGDLGDDAGGR